MPLIQANPAVWHLIMKLQMLAKKVKDWRAEVPENVDHSEVITDRILGLLGKDLLRNVVACIAINRKAGGALPRKNKDTSLNLNPPDQLPYSILAQDYCTEHKLMHADMAFNAGLHYDWIAALLNQRKASQDQKASVKECFLEGFAYARIAYRLAQKMGKVRHDRYVFAGALLVPAGKILMGVLYPKDQKEKSWAQFIADCEKHPYGKNEAIEALESKRFAMTHLEISSLIASFGQTVHPVERAIASVNHPYYLESVDPSLAQLASLWNVVRVAAPKPHKFSPSPSQDAFLKKSRLSMDLIKTIASEAAAEKVG
jgi:hypothetical protein